jgi:methylated-DNA-[protein]-cysteine S-methyltransferase
LLRFAIDVSMNATIASRANSGETAASNSATLRLKIESTLGTFIAYYSHAGLCGLDFPSKHARDLRSASESAVSSEVAQWHTITCRAIKSILAAKQPDKFPPMDLSAGTAFQKSVWRAMLEIRCGDTQSYGEIARSLKNPEAVRAVGAACGANPIPVLIPCHRVLAANKRIGGFSAGLDWKRKLLEIESPGLFSQS